MFYEVHNPLPNVSNISNLYRLNRVVLQSHKYTLKVGYKGIIKHNNEFYLCLGGVLFKIKGFPEFEQYINQGRTFIGYQDGKKRTFKVFGPEVIGADFVILLDEITV